MLKKVHVLCITIFLLCWILINYIDIKNEQLCDRCLEKLCNRRLHHQHILSKRASELHTKLQHIEHVTDVLVQNVINLSLSLNEADLKYTDQYFRVFVKFQNEINSLKKQSEVLKNETEMFAKPKQFNEETSFINQSFRINKIVYSCNETYKGALYGYPLYKVGFVRNTCPRVSLKDAVTLFLIFPSFKTNDSWKAVFSIFKTIKIITNKNNFVSSFKLNSDRLFLYHISENDRLGFLLNKVIRNVTTPYILFAQYLYHFDNSFDIERLIHVHESSGAGIVSGSRKTRKNEWNRGCYQLGLKLYTLEYKVGYFSSEKECLICTFTESPFLTSVQLFQSLDFDNNLSYGVFKDFFVNFNTKKLKLLVCPDVMFYNDQHEEKDFQLADFAKKWDIKKIISLTKKVLWFGCRKGFNYTTKSKCIIRRGMAVPPCCIANLVDAIKFLLFMFKKNGIKYLVQEGSVLGLVKFNGILPWERDFDISFLSEQFEKVKRMRSTFKKKGYQLIIDKVPYLQNRSTLNGGVIHIRANGWSIQLYGQQTLPVNETIINALNESIIVPENPGLYSRNRYGKELYKHVEHWMTLKHKSSWENYAIKNFSTCDIPNHHACLDQFQADGDIIFKN
ncbi:uncharacterized protein LOC105849534 [Hydra vulgaris]|uniref:Uncharacterized protein LOC105849534 n=1 Tax=Hydra vulgaris TaxID=6087 RepID=A0ABM4CZ68_HYDVU